MKKVAVIFTLILIAFGGRVSAQGRGKVSLQDFHFFKTVKFVEGNNSVGLDKEGTLRFVVRNGEIMNVMVQDPAGKIIRIAEPSEPVNNNPNPNPPCTGNLRCVQNSETNTVVCFCTPDALTSSSSETAYAGTGTSIQYTKLAKSTK